LKHPTGAVPPKLTRHNLMLPSPLVFTGNTKRESIRSMLDPLPVLLGRRLQRAVILGLLSPASSVHSRGSVAEITSGCHAPASTSSQIGLNPVVSDVARAEAEVDALCRDFLVRTSKVAPTPDPVYMAQASSLASNELFNQPDFTSHAQQARAPCFNAAPQTDMYSMISNTQFELNLVSGHPDSVPTLVPRQTAD
jgi:hypothetical protein